MKGPIHSASASATAVSSWPSLAGFRGKAFLIRHSRYAILGIFLLAAIITPTPDVFNLMIFATPMVALFYVGVFASYILVLEREGRRFPWRTTILIVVAVLLLVAALVYMSITRYGLKLVPSWPFLVH